MKTVTKDEQFSIKSKAKYRVVGLRYPKYLDFGNAIATIVRTLPGEEDRTLQHMVSMKSFREGPLYLEDTYVGLVWSEPIKHTLNMYHYC